MTGQGVAAVVVVASSSARRLTSPGAYRRANSQRKLLLSSHNESQSPGYVTAARLDWLRERLSERDLAVVRDVVRLRLVTGAQLERLHFAELGEQSRPVVRRRVLGRLVNWRVLTTLERRIGGERAGSSGLVFALGLAGKRLTADDAHAKRPSLPGVRYVRHVLAVSEVYVSLVERARSGALRLDTFKAEPASWWPDDKGGVLKPDGYAVVAAPTYNDYWWLEVDLATEHVPTLRRKFKAYVDFWWSGQTGLNKVMPRVLVTVPDGKRFSEIVRAIHQLPREGEKLFIVALHNDAAETIMRYLNRPN